MRNEAIKIGNPFVDVSTVIGLCNLEHVAPASTNLHGRFLRALGITEADEDPSNKLVNVELQLQWLREIGFDDVDCHWKRLELALLGGVKR